jgi:predicted RNA-binding protein with RPS1 domain
MEEEEETRMMNIHTKLSIRRTKKKKKKKKSQHSKKGGDEVGQTEIGGFGRKNDKALENTNQELSQRKSLSLFQICSDTLK